MTKRKIKVDDVMYTRNTGFKVEITEVITNGNFRFGVSEMYKCCWAGTKEPINGEFEPCDLKWNDN